MKEISKEEKYVMEMASEQNPYNKICPNRHLWEEGFKEGYKFAVGVCDFADALFRSQKVEKQTYTPNPPIGSTTDFNINIPPVQTWSKEWLRDDLACSNTEECNGPDCEGCKYLVVKQSTQN